MRKLTVLQTLKGSRIFDAGESFEEGTAEFAELEPEAGAGLVLIANVKPVMPTVLPPEPVFELPVAEPEPEVPEPVKRKKK
jgi:hypothetical protein